MRLNQVIQKPFGINVFGSALMRVDPDVASLSASTVSIQESPDKAFEALATKTNQINKYLQTVSDAEFASSRMNLSKYRKRINGELQSAGYQADMKYQILFNTLEQIDVIISNLVKAGITNIQPLHYQTTKLKEYRVTTRENAVAAAREKATIYCNAAGCSLGTLLHIEDVNPLSVSQQSMHVSFESNIASEDADTSVFNPGSIPITAAVILSYSIVTD